MKKFTAIIVVVYLVYALALTSFVSDNQTKSNWRWPAGEVSIEYIER